MILDNYCCVCPCTCTHAVTTPQGETADTGVSDNSFSPDVDLVPDSENVMQPTATDLLPTDPPATTAAVTTTESTTTPADTTVVILTTTSVTSANSVVQTGTSSGPVIHVPTNPVQFTPPPQPPPSRSHRGSFWNLLQLLLALGSEGGLGPLLLSQLYQRRPNQQSANSLFGILPPWAMFSKKMRSVYLASQSSGHLGGGLTGKTVATRFLGLPEGYPAARFISNRNSRRPGGVSSRQEQSPGFTGRRPFRNIPFSPWMLGMMET